MYLHAGLEASSTQVRLVCFFLGDGGLAFYDLEESFYFRIYNNRIYNKILDRDWFSGCLFVT